MSDKSDDKPGVDALSQILTSTPDDKVETESENLSSEEDDSKLDQPVDDGSGEDSIEKSSRYARTSAGSNIPTGLILKGIFGVLALLLIGLLVSELLKNDEVIRKVETKIEETINPEKAEVERNREYLLSSIEVGMDRKAKAGNYREVSKNSINTPQIVIAAINCQVSQVSSQLAFGADVDAVDKNGDSALSWAAVRGCAPVVKVLLAKNAQVALKNRKGETAYDWAVRGKNQEIINLIKQATAN